MTLSTGSETEQRRARIVETARRAGVLTRQQLELLAYEGVIQESDFDAFVAAHPRTVSQEEVGFELPDLITSAGSPELTYYEAIGQVLSRIGSELSPISRTLSELDPMNLGWFAEDRADALIADLTTAVLVIRNQSLYSILDEDSASAIGARVTVIATEGTAFSFSTAYADAFQVWLTSVANTELPNLAIAKWVIRRSGERSLNTQVVGENPLLEVIVAQKLVYCAFCIWHALAENTTLVPD